MTDRRPNPVDVEIGRRVRAERKRGGVSQKDLADAVGVTYQQMQKYEQGSNRVSASRLFLIARVLRIPLERLFPESDF